MLMRRYRPEDAATVVALFRDTVRRVNIRDYSAEQVLAWAPDEIDVEGWTRTLAANFTLVAEDDGQVVGFGDLEESGHIDRFYVHADHQGRGIGRAILTALEAEARRIGVGRLFTEASVTARPFFERQGFITLREQVVECRGARFINCRMEKALTMPNRARDDDSH